MNSTRNVIPVFRWASANADATVVDRILVKILPEILNSSKNITRELIESSQIIEVDLSLYDLIKKTAEGIVGSSFKEL
ncbi:MAG: hypothetical protein U9N33_04955 [Campylobacterota bacterium]|nr:hypothetical protein [Campylobacterota bacterium]